MTFVASGLYEDLKERQTMKVLDTFDKDIPADESLERRRQSLLVDLYITGTNAVTESGMLVNLDMIGNRIAALTFGPKEVILIIGRNKIVPDLEEAMDRLRKSGRYTQSREQREFLESWARKHRKAD